MAITALFSLYGHVGIVLAVVGLALCLFYSWHPHRFIPWAAAAVFLLSLVCAHLNSARHVARIEVERTAPAASEEDSFSYAELLEARGEDVAAVRFAEDTQDDLIDRAGLDEADLAYFDSIAEQPTPLPRPADEAAAPDADLLPTAILVDEATFALAHDLDRWNLTLTKILLVLAGFMIGYDYLRRFNHYTSATFPLPLPSALTNAVNPLSAVVVRPHPPRRPLPAEASWLARRGDSFILLADKPAAAEETTRLLSTGPKWTRPQSLIRIGKDNPDEITDDFIFESLWFGRGSFIIDDPVRARGVIDAILSRLAKRQASRARVRQSAHIIWDLASPVPEPLPDLAQATGFSILKD